MCLQVERLLSDIQDHEERFDRRAADAADDFFDYGGPYDYSAPFDYSDSRDYSAPSGDKESVHGHVFLREVSATLPAVQNRLQQSVDAIGHWETRVATRPAMIKAFAVVGGLLVLIIALLIGSNPAPQVCCSSI